VVVDPTGPDLGITRIARSSSWAHWPNFCRSGMRFNDPPGNRWYGLGFRIVRPLMVNMSVEAASIVGTWDLTYHWGSGSLNSTCVISFRTDGTFESNGIIVIGGTWYQSDDFVEWTYTNGTKYSGTLSSPTVMSGNIVSGIDDSTGTWSATRK
jgi:hypothetical protein